jgi:hypothetical protein
MDFSNFLPSALDRKLQGAREVRPRSEPQANVAQ